MLTRRFIGAQQTHERLVEKIEKINWQTREEISEKQETRRQLNKKNERKIDNVFSNLF